MPWTISFPPGSPQAGQEVCVTITGGGTSPPDITVSFNGDPPIEVREIKNLGGGVFVACFTVPANFQFGKISVSNRESGVGTQYF